MGLHIRLLTGGLFLLTSSALFAGQTVEQAVKASLNGTTHAATHTWSIDGEKFDLVVSSNGAERRFIFNGRVMYACGKLNAAQLKALGDISVKDPGILKKFQSGVCQEVPSNFLVRFFLSPVSAIETIDLTDGLKLTIEIDDFQLNPAANKKIGNSTLFGFSRSFTMKKSGGEGKATQSIKENFFTNDSLEARQNLWKEISKNLMRQPKGIELLKQLKKDRELVKGLIFESETTFETELAGGGKISGTISVMTTNSISADISGVRFKIPHDYEIFSPESLKLLAESSQPVENKDASNKKKDDTELLDKFQSVFFCAIAGALGCFTK